MPARILLLRHAEKPDDANNPGLSATGRVRAAALAVYLPATFGSLTHLIATKRGPKSERPEQTLKPLSDVLGLPIDARFEDAQFKELALEILTQPQYKGAKIALCWHHGEIPELAKALGVKDAPDHWGDEVFDRVWQLDFNSDHPKLTKVHQKLLFGDVP